MPFLTVFGLIEPDGDYLAKVKAWEACKAANVSIPKDLDKYFNGLYPDSEGIRMELGQMDDDNCLCNAVEGITEHHEDMEHGLIIDLKAIDQRITKIKMVNIY